MAPEIRCDGTTSEQDAHSIAATPPPTKPFRMMTTTYRRMSVTQNTSRPNSTALNMQKMSTLRREPMASEILPEMGLNSVPQMAPALTMAVPTMSGASRCVVT